MAYHQPVKITIQIEKMKKASEIVDTYEDISVKSTDLKRHGLA